MTYDETLNYLFQQFPMYQKVGKTAYKADLGPITSLLNQLGHPEKKIKCIHVAGTNGKGSVSHLLASALQANGYKVGLYTSPHLVDFRERIKINGSYIPKQFVVNFVNKHKATFEKISPSFFEWSVALAFAYFAQEKPNLAIIEVGMGGRLDATNVIQPELSIITNIGLDHQQFLGNTLKEIATEKAGIIKPNTPVVIGETQLETTPVFKQIAESNKAPIVFADQQKPTNYKTDLKGTYQEKNLQTVHVVLEQLATLWNLEESKNQDGLIHVVNNTKLLGRWQQLQEAPKVIADVGHNAEGLAYNMKQLKKEQQGAVFLMLGFVSDKNLETLANILPINATYISCKANNPRSKSKQTIHNWLINNNFNTQWVEGTIHQQLEEIVPKLLPTDTLYIGGSTFVVAEIFDFFS